MISHASRSHHWWMKVSGCSSLYLWCLPVGIYAELEENGFCGWVWCLNTSAPTNDNPPHWAFHPGLTVSLFSHSRSWGAAAHALDLIELEAQLYSLSSPQDLRYMSSWSPHKEARISHPRSSMGPGALGREDTQVHGVWMLGARTIGSRSL